VPDNDDRGVSYIGDEYLSLLWALWLHGFVSREDCAVPDLPRLLTRVIFEALASSLKLH